jgi:hypothetical protein
MPAAFSAAPVVFWLIGIASGAYAALESPVKPVQCVVKSWQDAVRYPFAERRTVTWLLGLFLTSGAFEFLFSRVVPVSPPVLLALGLSWRAITVGAIGFLAVRIHQWVLVRGEKPYERRPGVELRAVLFALLIFLALLAVNFGVAWLVGKMAPEFARSLNRAAPLLQSIVFAPLALVRPALSLGMGAPWRGAFVAFWRHPIAYFVWISALALPALAARYVIDTFFKPGDPSAIHFLAGQAAFALFNTVDCIAFEMSTLRMLRNVVWRRLSQDPDRA